jgi:hypothetical protein
MQIDVAMELAKNEIVNNINEVSSKYNLPFCLLNNIIQAIALETNNITQQELAKNMEDYKRQQNMEIYKKKKKESDK